MTEKELEKLADVLSEKLAKKLEHLKYAKNWKDDDRSLLIGEWYCPKNPYVEFNVRYEWFGFVMYLTHIDKKGNRHSKAYAVHQGDTYRQYYIVRKGKIIEMLLDGDVFEDPEYDDGGLYLEWEDMTFEQKPGSHKFYYDCHVMWEEDEKALSEMCAKENKQKTDE